MSFTENAKTRISRRVSVGAELFEILVMVQIAEGDHLSELILTVGAFRGGLQLEISEDRLVAPGFFYGS